MFEKYLRNSHNENKALYTYLHINGSVVFTFQLHRKQTCLLRRFNFCFRPTSMPRSHSTIGRYFETSNISLNINYYYNNDLPFNTRYNNKLLNNIKRLFKCHIRKYS